MAEKILTAQQKRILTQYASTLDMEKSARAAGYRSTNSLTQVRTLLLRDFYKNEFEKILSERVAMLDIPRAYIIKKYLKLVEYATQSAGTDGSSLDPVLALRALDGLCKQLPKENGEDTKDPLITKIEGLDHERI